MGPEPIADSVVAAAASVATGASSAPTHPANEVPTWFTDGPNYEWRWFSRQSRPKTILCFGADADGGGRFCSWRWDCLYSGHGASVLMDPYIHHVAGHRWQDVTEYLAGTQTDSDQAAKSDACYEFRRGTTPKTRCTLSGSTLASMPPVHMWHHPRFWVQRIRQPWMQAMLPSHASSLVAAKRRIGGSEMPAASGNSIICRRWGNSVRLSSCLCLGVHVGLTRLLAYPIPGRLSPLARFCLSFLRWVASGIVVPLGRLGCISPPVKTPCKALKAQRHRAEARF